MRRATALALLCLQCFTLTADAATRYVDRETGSDANNGLTGHPWLHVSYANAHLAAGETCVIDSSTFVYDAAITPVNANTTWLGDSAARSVHVPGVVVVPGASFTVVNGMDVRGSVSWQEKYFHLRNSCISGNLTGTGNTTGATLLSNRIGTDEGTSQWYIQPTKHAATGDSCDIENNHGALRMLGTLGSAHLLHWQPSRDTTGSVAVSALAMKGWTVKANRETLTMTHGQNFEKVAFLSRCRLGNFTDNLFHFRDSTGIGAGTQTFVVRDSMKLNVFLRDTVEFEASDPLSQCSGIYWYSSGNNLPDSLNSIRYCLFKSNVTPYQNASFWEQFQFQNRDSIYRNCFVCNHGGDCVYLSGASDSVFFEHNDLVNFGSGRPLKQESSNGCVTSAWTGYFRDRGNIVYSRSNNEAFSEQEPAGVGHLIADYNVVYDPNIPRTKAIKYSECGQAPTWYALPLVSAFAIETHSVWGSPVFTDSSYATFDGNLGFGSAAIGAGPDGTDAGAYAFVASAPSQVSDLAAIGSTSSDVLLMFTAPGAHGNTGTATSYDLRYSTSDINETNFTSATAFSVDAPTAAGATEIVRVTGLSAATTYYFAVRASNGSRTSFTSNSATATTWRANTIEP